MVTRKWILLSLLLAIAFIFQNLRLIFPVMPPPVNIFLIGSLLNTVMAFSILYTKSYFSMVIGILLPLGAFFQGQLPIAIMMPIVALGNCCYIFFIGLFQKSKLIYLAPILKAILLYFSTMLVIHFFHLPTPLTKVLLFIMSWPQVITGLIGLYLAQKIQEKIL